jgi:hypothetical protein
VREIIPTDIPEPKGKYVTLSHYFDVNLYHDMVTGRFITAILHFLNQTATDWYSKKQAMVETATFGSEFIAARTTINQIVDLQMTLRYLGIPIREKSYVFRDNDKICMMTRLACNQAVESSYWRMDNNSDVGLLMGYVLYRLPIELESMDLDTFPH